MIAPQTKGMSIFTRMLLAFMLINIATSATLMLIAYSFSSMSIQRHTKEGISRQINAIRDNFEQNYGRVLRTTMRSLADSSTLDDYLQTPDAEKFIATDKFEQLMVQTITNVPYIKSITFADPIGHVKIAVEGKRRRKWSDNLSIIGHSSPGDSQLSLLAARKLFKLLMSTPLLLTSGYMDWFIPPREILVDGPFLDEGGNFSLLAGVSKLDVEARSSGGVLLIQQNLDEFFAYLQELKFFDENVVWVYDGEGRNLQRPSSKLNMFDPVTMLPGEFQANARLLEVKEGLLAVQDLSLTPGKTFIRIAVSIPSALLTRDFRPAVKFFSIVLLASLVVVLIAALYVSRYLSKPIVELSSAVARFARGDLSTQVDVQATGEVKTLVESFNQMTRELHGSITAREATTQHLIEEVAERKRAEQELKQAEQQLEELAYYDSLTGLANRTLFGREFNDVLTRCSRTGADGALLLLDLDRFKEVNDSLGHAAGDELLIKVAHLIGRVLGKDHFLARLGGDEFTIIVPKCGDRDAVGRLAADVISAVTGSISLESGEVAIGTSIGIVLIPQDGTNSSDLLRNADLALYAAKEDGRGRFAFFKPDMNTAVQYKTELARDLRRAVSENVGLAAHYQPQVCLSTGRVVGYEALARWNHPTRGNVPPSEFIPIAESSRLICDLGLWILRQAAIQAKAWLDAGEPPREMAVNVSAAQIWHTDVVREVASVLEETGLPPHLLCLELTESLFADHAKSRVRTVLRALKDLGVMLALDDFGTDYSSLGYLTQLPFDKLKIDRVFVDGITDSDRSRELLKGIIALGCGLGMTVQGEGAETFEEVEILREFGCDLVQGYAFARPTAAAEALTFARGCEARAYGDDALTGLSGDPTQALVARLRAAAA